jgi:putative peptide zinc metalloprotease protein
VIRRSLAALAVALVCLLGLAVPASAQAPQETGEDQSQAIAVNTEDGASVFRLAFAVRYVTDGVVDQTNTAVALASCTDCRTVALAFQVVLVEGDADIVIAENRALALNVACEQCLTYASATQIVLGVDGPVRLTGEGYRRMAQIAIALRRLEKSIETIDPNELLAVVREAEAELIAVYTEELRPIGPPTDGAPPTNTTSTTMVDDGDTTTTTTVTSSSSTTAVTTTTTPSTTTTAAPSTTAAP